MHCTDIRQRFIDYYQHLGFRLLPRAPMLHPSIPMSFVMSAGLVQVETSLANAEHRSGDKFVLVQDCFRHFDLQTIGTDNIHLSLFEMPAAFIFGNNNRKTAITHIWTVATDVLGINPQRLWVSYFGGDQVEGQEVPEDRETYQAWRAVGVPQQRLVGLGRKHNYWVQGGGFDNGGSEWRKCGANTELFYDIGAEHACSPMCQPGCRCGRFVEFSNTLFVSHHLNYQTNEFIVMDEPFTETVIGTERVAMITQQVPSVFDTELYRFIITVIRQYSSPNGLPTHFKAESERLIADHLRALCVLVADGAPPPGKNGRERIIKFLIRGMIARQIMLGIEMKNFLAILHVFLKNYHITQESVYSTLESYFTKETQRFQRTVDRGYYELEKLLKHNHGKTLSGQQVVYLEKSHGLPSCLIFSALKRKYLDTLESEYEHALGIWKEKNVIGQNAKHTINKGG